MRPLITVLKALSDETRFRLLDLLLSSNLCGRALARQLGVSEAAVSQHLKVLREAGLVEGEKRGYWMHYSVQRDVLKQVTHELDRLSRRSAVPTERCFPMHAATKGYKGKEVKAMCQCCCERPEKLKGKPEDCSPERIRDCHGDVKNHPCTTQIKEEK
jgi:ArsR family transcriptional regulator, arsenate/arsenite/antimonite-responsive transcriptional repressor